MFTINRYLSRLILIAIVLVFFGGCQKQPQQIIAIHQSGQYYLVAIGDTSGGMGTAVQMTLVKPDCTHTHTLADSIVFTR